MAIHQHQEVAIILISSFFFFWRRTEEFIVFSLLKFAFSKEIRIGSGVLIEIEKTVILMGVILRTKTELWKIFRAGNWKVGEASQIGSFKNLNLIWKSKIQESCELKFA